MELEYGTTNLQEPKCTYFKVISDRSIFFLFKCLEVIQYPDCLAGYLEVSLSFVTTDVI